MKNLLAVLVVAVALSFAVAVRKAPPEMTDSEIAQIEASVSQAITSRWADFKVVLEKQSDGTWLIDSECYNSDTPPEMAPEG